jgi:protein-S-isoprenylcysteine O-methyltransferase Ste14
VARPIVYVVTLVVMVFGLFVRWSNILTLGRLFTVDVVAIPNENQALLRSFVSAYASYCARTRRFKPGLFQSGPLEGGRTLAP